MLNVVVVLMILAALACGALSGRMDAVAIASTESAGAAVTLAIGLVGVMAFWIGAMGVLQRAGVLAWAMAALKKPMGWLFPDVPVDHPAMAWMMMNMTANMLGLANAATPFGLKAMLELDELNEQRGTATDAMALFLAINTSQLAILPTGIIALRASLESASPGAIIVPTWIATACSTLVAIVVAKLLVGLPIFAVRPRANGPLADERESPSPADVADTAAAEAVLTTRPPTVTGWRLWTTLAGTGLVVAALGYGAIELALGTPAALDDMKLALGSEPVMGEGPLVAFKQVAAAWPLPLLIGLITIVGMLKGVKVYDCVVEGGKEGFQIALKIIPYLVAILVAVGMLRASGAIDLMTAALGDATAFVGMPAEALPMALLRPLTGNGAYAVAAEIMKTNGPDSFVGYVVSTMQGSTETTFYVLALYFGVVGVRRVRHTLIACLAADITGLLCAAWAVAWVLM